MLRGLCRFLLAGLFVAAGTLHLVMPRLFLPIMPPAIPAKLACIVVTGMAELAGAAGLLAPAGRVRTTTGWALVVLLLAMFPANIYMAMAHVRIGRFPQRDWIAWARLPLQFVLIAMVAAACRLRWTTRGPAEVHA